MVRKRGTKELMLKKVSSAGSVKLSKVMMRFTTRWLKSSRRTYGLTHSPTSTMTLMKKILKGKKTMKRERVRALMMTMMTTKTMRRMARTMSRPWHWILILVQQPLFQFTIRWRKK
uniref:Uncharacterized protein n=1 Tax=Opuntia streptacantha TaxID=393608 RepID=A0A7C8ZTS3_OPUST